MGVNNNGVGEGSSVKKGYGNRIVDPKYHVLGQVPDRTRSQITGILFLEGFFQVENSLSIERLLWCQTLRVGVGTEWTRCRL